MRNPQKIMVTGASGSLGLNFLVQAFDAGVCVEGIYNNSVISIPGVRCKKLNIADHDEVETHVRASRPDWIVHCAAETDVDSCQRHPDRAWRINTEATRNLAEAARDVGARMLYVSSDSVFDGIRGNYIETDEVAPMNVYAKSKLAGEEAVASVSDRFLVVRTNIYGWSMQGATNLPKWVLARLDEPGDFPGFHDVFHSPILVNDLSDIMMAMILRDLSGLYHVGGGQTCAKIEFVRCMTEVFGHDSDRVRPVSIDDIALTAPRPRNTSLNSNKIRAALDIDLPDLKTGLTKFRKLRDSHFTDRLRAAGGGGQGLGVSIRGAEYRTEWKGAE